MEITIFKNLMKSQTRSIPLVIDEASALQCVSEFLSTEIASLEECRTWNFSNIYLYEKEEGKTGISVKIIRDWIESLAEKPYSWKNIYLLSEFDEATPQAMNAALKVLEEPPAYALILLIVKNPESLLETIQSRTMNVYRGYSMDSLSLEIRSALDELVRWNVATFIEMMQSWKLDESTTLLILTYLLENVEDTSIPLIEECIENLLVVHENPRNILDRAILSL